MILSTLRSSKRAVSFRFLHQTPAYMSHAPPYIMSGEAYTSSSSILGSSFPSPDTSAICSQSIVLLNTFNPIYSFNLELLSC